MFESRAILIGEPTGFRAAKSAAVLIVDEFGILTSRKAEREQNYQIL